MIHSIVMATLMALATPAGGAANLAEAAMHRDMVAVRSLLNQKADVNAPGPDGTPAFHWVVRVDDLDSPRFDSRGRQRQICRPLWSDANLPCGSNGNAAMLKLLLDSGADANTTDPTGETR